MTKSLLTVAALSAAVLACGGRQSPYDSTTLAFGSIEAAVPADATYAVVVDLDAETSEAAQASVSQSMDASALWSEWLGVDADGDIFAETGIDTDGGYAIFSRGVSPIIVARLADGTRWDRTVDAVIDHNPDLDWGTRDVVGTTFDYAATEWGPVLIGTRGEYAVARIGLGEDDLSQASADLEALFYGYGEVPAFDTTETYTELVSRQRDGESLYSYTFATTEALSDLFAVFRESAAAEQAAGMGPVALPPAAEGNEDVCQAAEERITASYRWVGGAAFTEPGDPLASRSEVLVAMSHAHAERLGDIFNGAIDFDGASMADAGELALYAAGNADLRAMVDSFTADPAASTCSNLGMLPGVAAMLTQSMGRLIDYNLQYFNGDFALALGNIELAGFLPFVHMAVMLGADNPPALATQIGRQLEARGASVTVDQGEHGPIYNYRMLHLRISTYNFADRMVMVVGNIPESVVMDLGTRPLRGEDAPAGTVAYNGPRMRDIVDVLLQLADASGTFSPEQLEELRGGLGGMSALDRMFADMRIDGDTLVIELEQSLAPAP